MSWRNQPQSSGPQSARASSRSSSRPLGSELANRWAPRGQSENMDDGAKFNQSWANDHGETEEDLNNYDYLKSKSHSIQQDSLSSTRRALGRLQETEQVGQNNLLKMATQSDQLTRVESRLDMAETKIKVTDAKTDYLQSLSKVFFLPAFGGKKVRQKEAALKKAQEEAELKEQERDESHQRRLQKLHSAGRTASIQQRSSSERSYSTPNGLERDELESEMDDNLDQISAGLGRLKMMGLAMNEELDAQDQQMHRLYDKTAYTDERVQKSTHRLDRLLKK